MKTVSHHYEAAGAATQPLLANSSTTSKAVVNVWNEATQASIAKCIISGRGLGGYASDVGIQPAVIDGKEKPAATVLARWVKAQPGGKAWLASLRRERKASFRPPQSQEPTVWSEALAAQCSADFFCGRGIKPNVVKLAPEGFIAELHKQREAARKMLAAGASTPQSRRTSSVKYSRKEELSDELGVKPTDAMFWKLPGSYESGKR